MSHGGHTRRPPLTRDPGPRRPRAVPDPRPVDQAHRPRRPERAAHPGGLSAVAPRVLHLLQTRRGPLGSSAIRASLEQLRHAAHDTADPALRAVVHVACAHLSANDFDEAEFALLRVTSLIGPS